MKPAAFRRFTFLGGATTGVVTLLLSTWGGLHWFLSYLAGVNCATFYLYGHDKLAATRGWLRVPERALHLFAFVGGTPFAYLAQRLFRHKTIKASFRVIFWILALVQVALIAWAIWYLARERGGAV